MMQSKSPVLMARTAGLFALLEALTSGFGQVIVPRMLVVPGDGATTAANVLAHSLLFRLSIVAALIGVGATFAWQLLSVSTTKSPQPVPITQAAAPAAAAISPELVQQLEAVARDLAVVRDSVEQLAAKQEQMAQSIAKPQAVKRNVKHKMSSPPRTNAPPKPAAQALSVPRPEPNPRPPLPPLPVPPDRR